MTFMTPPAAPTLGLGCWAIGGPFAAGDKPLGWGAVDDAVSTRAIHAALDHGVTHFDTAQAYGTGHSESVLGAALATRPDTQIATKIGIAIDPSCQQITGEITDPATLRATIDASRRRLRRDRIDMVLLHLNELAPDAATPIFDMLDGLVDTGWIAAYGWSTDFPDSAAAFADRAHFTCVEHAMNVFHPASAMVAKTEELGLLTLIRSPLAMGLLSGKFGAQTRFSADDVRSKDQNWMAYFEDGRVNPAMLERLDAVRDILTSGGRTPAQGALAWLWGRTPNAIPIPGFRTPEQVTDLCGALDHGPLTPDQMAQVETLINRPPEGAPRAA